MTTATQPPAADLTAHEALQCRAFDPKSLPKLKWTQLLAFYADNAAVIQQIEGLPAQILAAYEAGDVVAAWSLSKQLGDLVVQLEQAWANPPVVAESEFASHEHRAKRAGLDPRKLGDGTILSTIVNAIIGGVKNAGGIGAIISIILKLAGGVKPAA